MQTIQTCFGAALASRLAWDLVEIHIFDVEHGSCAAVVSPSGRVLMLDCGHNASTGWRPSTWVAQQRRLVANLTISNFDEDHVTDLPSLRPYVESFTVNWTVPVEWIRREKAAAGIGPGIRSLLDMMDAANSAPHVPIDWGAGFALSRFYHSLGTFDDENSLSVVTFVECGAIRIVFPGDLTAAAWRRFLSDPAFVGHLRNTSIFVASYHGRADGYCPEVFDYCAPDVVVCSDKSVMYDSQVVDYSRHAKGIVWNGTDRRYCLTTRNDGALTITPTLAGGYYIQASR